MRNLPGRVSSPARLLRNLPGRVSSILVCPLVSGLNFSPKLGGKRRIHLLAEAKNFLENPIKANYGIDPNSTGLCKIKLKQLGICVVYQVVREGDIMKSIVIATMSDEEAYGIASKRAGRLR